MKKYGILFITVCLLLCLIPSAGMFLAPTTQTSENRPMADAPSLLTAEGAFNTAVFKEFEAWFNDHMSLRNRLVSADAFVQTRVFRESSVSGVISGTDGWLYYSSTLPDYQGTALLSDRELARIAGNLNLVQTFLAGRGIAFAVTIPPNKNTLYGEHMPYYAAAPADTPHSAVRLAPYLEKQGVNYVNLFEAFSGAEESLYLRTDSHWNGAGAAQAYRLLSQAVGRTPADLSASAHTETLRGDLSRMLYSFYGPTEEDVSYAPAPQYAFDRENADVEDGWLAASCASGKGTLLMFRDSFANTLIPLFAGDFAASYYTKGEPNALEHFVVETSADCVILEKVERNIRSWLTAPPILSAPAASAPMDYTIAETASTLEAETPEEDVTYIALRGRIDSRRLTDTSEVIAAVGDGFYRAYLTEDDGYLLYLKKDTLPQGPLQIRVFVVNGEDVVQVLSQDVDMETAVQE